MNGSNRERSEHTEDLNSTFEKLDVTETENFEPSNQRILFIEYSQNVSCNRSHRKSLKNKIKEEK